MKHMIRLFALLILLTQPVLAGVVFEVEVDDQKEREQPSHLTVSVAGPNLKMEINDSENEHAEMIFRGDRKEMVIVDHEQKSYVVLDRAMLESIGEQVQGAMKEVHDALAQVPEDQRAMVEEMMKEQLGALGGDGESGRPKAEVKRTSSRSEQGGYPCVKYEVWFEDKKQRELWVTDWDQVEGGKQAVEAFKNMAVFFQEMMDSFGAAGGFMDDSFDNPFAQMDQLSGFPVVTRELEDDGSLESEATLRSAIERDLDPSAFEPPKGYHQRSIM